MDPSLVPREQFEDMVRDALDALPDWMLPTIQETAVLVEDVPPRRGDGTMLLGQFRGIPLTRAGGRVPGSLPDTITLYRLPILAVCSEPAEVPARVLKVLGHEFGHAMGLGEARLRELGWY